MCCCIVQELRCLLLLLLLLLLLSLPWYICKDRGEKPRLRRGKCRNAPAA